MDDINPLPYVITFAVLLLILLGVFTWAIGVWYREFNCGLQPGIWCSDDWTCNRACAPGSYNKCFSTNEPTGLASCLYGPLSDAANVCNTFTDESDLACDCTPGMQSQTVNCFSGCPLALADLEKTGATCCCTGASWCTPCDIK